MAETPAGKYILELTQSQKMALTDALIEHVRCPNSTEVFINMSEQPPVETSMGELIRLITDAKWFGRDSLPERRKA
jgi:hypothetical protein